MIKNLNKWNSKAKICIISYHIQNFLLISKTKFVWFWTKKHNSALSQWTTFKTPIRAWNELLLNVRWTYETKVQKPVQGSTSYERTARPIMHGCCHVMALCLRGREAPPLTSLQGTTEAARRRYRTACWLQPLPNRTDGPAVFRAPPTIAD